MRFPRTENVKNTLLLLAKAAACALIFFAAFRFCERKTDGFSMAKISSSLDFHQEWEPRASLDITTIEKIRGEKFTYLGFGGQCYAFESEDKQLVLKFFSDKLSYPPAWLLSLPLPSFLSLPLQQQAIRKMKKVKRDFLSCKIAFDELQTESALLYIHLNKTHDPLHITLYDKLRVKHDVDISQKEFVLQKKAKPFLPHFKRLLEQNDEADIIASLQSVKNLLIGRCQKGIFDEDASLHRNIGFLGNEAVFIDIGRFKQDPSRKDPSVYTADLHKIAKDLKEKLKSTLPTLASYLDAVFLQKEAT